MKYAALIELLLGYVTKTQAFISAYRFAFMASLGLLVAVVGLWAFAFRPQTLIVITLASLAAYKWGPSLVAWVDRRVNQ